MPRWTPEDIPWDRFDPDKLDPDVLKLVKAAALTEFNAAQYTAYLNNVFADDREIAGQVGEWQLEEEQHGRVLGRYAELASPGYDFRAAFDKFRQGYVIPTEVDQSIRGSRVGEMLARCIVETGTSSFYSALSEATEEPVLQAICRRIAGDEFRHYRMFLDGLRKYQPKERVPLWRRVRVAIGRVRETDDDELAYAYHCANENERAYDRAHCNAAYATRAYRLYRYHHAEKAVGMILKASGLPAQGWLAKAVSRWTYRKMQERATRAAA